MYDHESPDVETILSYFNLIYFLHKTHFSVVLQKIVNMFCSPQNDL